jgi:hypothetical protein
MAGVSSLQEGPVDTYSAGKRCAVLYVEVKVHQQPDPAIKVSIHANAESK